MLAVSVSSSGAAACAPACLPPLARLLTAGRSHALLTRSIAASHTRRRLCTASAAASSSALRPVFSTPSRSRLQRISAEPLPSIRRLPSSHLAAAPRSHFLSWSSSFSSTLSQRCLHSAAPPLHSPSLSASSSPLSLSPALAAVILVRCFSSAPSVAPKRASSGSPDSTFSSSSAFTSSSQLNAPPSVRPPVTASSVPPAPAASVPTPQSSASPSSAPSTGPSTAAAGSPTPASSPSVSKFAAADSGTAVSTSPAASTPPPPPSLLAAEASPPPSRVERIWQRVKAEIRHYVNGTKLLYAEIKIAYGLTLQVLRGHELSRRERRQLTRTSADILRLVPFLVIVIVPFMEFALPVLLKLFPNMLPSTYLDHKGEEAKLKKQLAAKIEMARFLQDTTALMAGQLLEKQQAAAAAGAAGEASEERRLTVSSFQSLMQKVRRGESVRNSEILSISRLFDEDFTLEHLNHEQLAAMCRLLDLRVFGSDWVLRYKLNKKLDELRDDDKQIKKEGVDSLTLPELREACRARGIHSGQSEQYMRRKLRDWLELSLEHDVPISLLVLSRAFSVSLAGVRDADVELSEGLAATLKHIPDVVVEDTAQTIVDRSDDVHEKLELVRKEEEEARRSKQEARQQQQQQQLPAAAGGKPQQEAAAAVRTPTVVGLADIKEKLEDIREDNDELEEDIDQAIAAKEQQSAAAAAGAIRLPADSTADGKEVSTEVDRERPGLSSAGRAEAEKPRSEPRAEKKKVARVDRLNDTVEELVARVQEELQQHEQQTQNADAAKQQQERLQQQQQQKAA